MSYCDWDADNAALTKYHDEEWGVPVHGDRRQFEFLMMEAMQCGLNWNMMLQKREIFRACFDGFDFDRVADYGEDDIRRIMETPGMIRSRRKIEAVIRNARCFQKIRAEFGSFSDYLWGFSGGRTILYRGHEKGVIPVSNGLSDKISGDLRARGFRYLGSVTVYSHLQACGVINDHGADCPCFSRINAANPTIQRRRYLEKGARDYSGRQGGKAAHDGH
ncbi:MAG: DNA-3-methyladenine glycosylase I [Oscillospiraceae bacterium]|nr:DNA-3-methyladenine glycosylase I [Oscillospiraceae bacterium]